jgi:hypothetical protein
MRIAMNKYFAASCNFFALSIALHIWRSFGMHDRIGLD